MINVHYLNLSWNYNRLIKHRFLMHISRELTLQSANYFSQRKIEYQPNGKSVWWIWYYSLRSCDLLISRAFQEKRKNTWFANPFTPSVPFLCLFAIFKVCVSPLWWHVFLGSLPSWSRVRFLRSKFLCEIYKTQCWLDGLVGWWLGRGWYVAQQDYHLSNNRATGNSNTLESSSKKTQCYLVCL